MRSELNQRNFLFPSLVNLTKDQKIQCLQNQNQQVLITCVIIQYIRTNTKIRAKTESKAKPKAETKTEGEAITNNS